ncbi:MAG: FkbM family methyltransferase [Candidatus Omnitrophota bacterium]
MSGSAALSRIFLLCLSGIFKNLPDGMYKHHVIVLLGAIPWKEMRLPAMPVDFGRNTGVKIIPHIGEADFKALLLRNIEYETEIYDFVESRINEYDIVIDIGANVGLFSVFCAVKLRHQGHKKVYAFEPSGEACRRLAANVEANKLENIHIVNKAVSDTNGYERLYEPKGHLSNASLNRSFAAIFDADPVCTEVPSVAAASLAGLASPGGRVLLKIDAEGAEARILKSLEPVMNTLKPDIIIEVLKPFEGELNAVDFLLKPPYEIFNITDKGLVKQDGFAAAAGHRDFFICRKNSSKNNTAVI